MHSFMERLSAIILLLVVAGEVAEARTVYGTVMSEIDSTAVAGATCRLLVDNLLVAGTTSGASGEFSLDTDAESALTLEIGMTGYAGTSILIDRGNKNVDLGTVYLGDGVALGEVTVTGQSMIESRGRTIVLPSAADVKASATSVSLFQKLPLAGLEADPITRTIKVDGGAPMILINGVPSSMADVNTLQPKDIARIVFSRGSREICRPREERSGEHYPSQA